MTPPDGGWRSRTFASFQRPAFRSYYLGLLCNMAGFWMRIAATALFAFELTGSREALGWITVASLLPWVPIAPLAGALAERIDQRIYLVVVYFAVALVNVVLGLGIAQGWVGWTELLVLTLIVSSLRGMELPARHAIVRRLVDVPSLPNAIGLNAAGFHLMNAIGNAAAGLLYAASGPAACFFVVAAASVLMAVQLMRLKLPPQAKPPHKQSPWRDLAEGFRYVGMHAITRTLVACAAGVAGLLLSFRVLMPAITQEILGLQEDGYGVIMAVSGAGSFVGALWVASGSGGRGRRVRNIFITIWLGCGAALLIAWTDSVPVVAFAMLIAGFCHVGFMASANTTVQETVPDHLRARVMGIWALVFGAAFPLGGMLQGLIAERVNEAWAITTLGGAALILSVVVFATSYRKLRDALHHEYRRTDEILAAAALPSGTTTEGPVA